MNKCCFFFLILASFGSAAHDTRIDKITVYGQRQGLLGQSISASQGQISAQDIARKPIARTGEILEFVPGMVVTQHSGSGKANQYFLRGFNLDHGTDFSTNVDGMPVNMRTHGHGQGYSDLNFIIPELVHSIDYFKGPYYAAIGDFSSAGAAQFSLMKRLNTNMLSIEYGQDNYQRLVAAHGTKVGTGDLVAALELQSYDGPWLDSDQDAKKRNAMLRYSNDTSEREFSITLMAYDNEWAGADQIPQRAVTNGDLDRLASVDKTLGGESSRYSLSANWLTDDWASSAYVIKSELDLFSNFTYFLEDPINGDQFEQVDNRVIAGANFQYIGNTFALNTPWYYRVGSELRFDNISEVALYKTAQRKRLRSVRNDHVKQWSLAFYGQLEGELTDRLMVRLGTRLDHFDGQVDGDNTNNSGKASDAIVSFKFGSSYRYSENVELFANAGNGFHSNDARGTTISEDPLSGQLIDAVDFLVRSTGAEIGAKWFDSHHYNLSASLWTLALDSELLFVGDAGNVDSNRPSRRSGIEFSGYYWLSEQWSLDLELAWTHTRFSNAKDDEGRYIEGSVPFVGSLGINYSKLQWFASLRSRYLGARTLDSNNEFSAGNTLIHNGLVGYRFNDFSVTLKVLNVLNSKSHDIDYRYSSRLPGESDAGVEDLHFHPVEPRSVRLSIRYDY